MKLIKLLCTLSVKLVSFTAQNKELEEIVKTKKW